MLSIVIGSNHEWWVNSQLFDRLFESSLRLGIMPNELAHLQGDVNIHYGIELDDDDYSNKERAGFIGGLKAAAERELGDLGDVSPESGNSSYKSALVRWLDVVHAYEQDAGSQSGQEVR